VYDNLITMAAVINQPSPGSLTNNPSNGGGDDGDDQNNPNRQKMLLKVHEDDWDWSESEPSSHFQHAYKLRLGSG